MASEKPDLRRGRTMIVRDNGGKGSDVASANNMSLSANGNVFSITGTTQINLIDVGDWLPGSRVVLLFDTSVTVKHNQTASGNFKKILLSGAADFSGTANDSLVLVLEGTPGGSGTQWREIARTVI